MILTGIIAGLGLLVSFYAFRTELKVKLNKKYKAFCDRNNRISCSKTLSSKYGNLFGIPNSLAGIFFYASLLVLAFLNITNYIFYLSIIAFLISILLAYLSFFKVKTICPVCISIYIINTTLLIVSYPKI